MKIKDRYFLSNIAIVLGLLIPFFFANDTGMMDSLTPGLQIIFGALAYKAMKKQKFHTSLVWQIVEVIAALLFVLLFSLYIRENGSYVNTWNELQMIHITTIVCVIVSYFSVRFSK